VLAVPADEIVAGRVAVHGPGSAFDDPDWAQSGHALGQAGLLAGGDHLVDVLSRRLGSPPPGHVGVRAQLDPLPTPWWLAVDTSQVAAFTSLYLY
jgi:hypothetical protein